MPSLPDAMVLLLSPFASLLDARILCQVQILLMGVVLAPGRGTVSSALYALGLPARGDFARYHHDLSRVLLEQRGRSLPPCRAVWYPKTVPIFTDALALMRLALWTGTSPLARSRPTPDMENPPLRSPARLQECLCDTG